jgi:hypothetical protein
MALEGDAFARDRQNRSGRVRALESRPDKGSCLVHVDHDPPHRPLLSIDILDAASFAVCPLLLNSRRPLSARSTLPDTYAYQFCNTYQRALLVSSSYTIYNLHTHHRILQLAHPRMNPKLAKSAEKPVRQPLRRASLDAVAYASANRLSGQEILIVQNGEVMAAFNRMR